MTLKEYCDSCQNKESHKCHSCMGKYFDGVLQGKPTKYREKPQTNADRIRAMSDEKLAEFLEGDYGNMAVGWALEWLQQPVKENDYDS